MTRHADHPANQHIDNDYIPVIQRDGNATVYLPRVRGKQILGKHVSFTSYETAVAYARGWDKAQPKD